MRVTLLGHASVLVEMDGATCLMDPVFFDPFEEGAVVSCPRRAVYPERLPAIDILIVSHRHPDHFDLRSLAQVPRECDVIMPADPLLAYALDKLGFQHIHPVHPMAPILSGTFELYPTRSEVRTVREFGMVFKDASGVFWNQVDSFLSAPTIEGVQARFGRIDLLFAMYASQNFDFFETGSHGFPYETHRDNLEKVLRIDPVVVAPGAAGFRFSGDQAWLNAFLFPIDRERFAEDLGRLAFRGRVEIMNPGDQFAVRREGVSHHARASGVAETLEDDRWKIRFDPTAPIPGLQDPNPSGYGCSELKGSAESFIEGLTAYACGGDQRPDRVIDLYRRHRARYAIGIVFPSGQEEWYQLDFRSDTASLSGRLQGHPSAHIVHRIAASALVDWTRHRRSFFYVRACSRRYGTLYELSSRDLEVGLRPRALPDLLMHYLLNVMPGSEYATKHHVDLELAAICSTTG